MKKMRTLALLAVLLLACPLTICGQANNEFMIFPPSTSVPGLQVDSNGFSFIAANNRLYKLNNQLEMQETVILPDPVVDRGLSLSPDGSTLVVCLTDQSCRLYNTTSLTDGPIRTEMNAIGSIVSDVAVFSNGNDFFTGSINRMLVTAMTGNMILNQFGDGFVRSSENNDAAHSGPYALSSGFQRAFYGGFQRDQYSYFVLFDYEPTNARAFRILRVCNGDCSGSSSCGFDALYEAGFSCGLSSISNAGRVCGFTVIDNFAGLVGPIIVVSRCEDPSFTRSAVCLVSLNTVNQAMDNKFTSCSTAGSQSAEEIDIAWRSDDRCTNLFPGAVSPLGMCNIPIPLGVTVSSTNRVFTGSDSIISSVAVKFEDFSFVFMGTETSSGVFNIRGYDLSPGTPTTVSMPFLVQSTSSRVHQLSYRNGDTFITAATQNSVFQVDFDTCGTLTNCTACFEDPNPLCGWCVVENKCSRQSLCQNSNITGRWVTNITECIDDSVVTPEQLVVNATSPPINLRIQLGRGRLPDPLPGETYSCYFSPDVEGINAIMTPTVEINPGTEYFCEINLNELPVFRAGFTVGFQSSLFNTPFGLTNGALTVFACEQGSSCTECLSDNSPCGWCNLNKICSGVSSACRNSTQFLELSPGQTHLDFCPLIDNSSPYVQPVRLAQDIIFQAVNLIPPADGFMYRCWVNGVSLDAVFNNSDSITCLVPESELDLGAMIGSQDVNAEIRWMGNGVDSLIEGTGSRNTTVLLYDCQDLATGCSSCIGERMGQFTQCGWCESDSMCQTSPECTGGALTTMGSNCPAPVITSFFPPTGHVNGGTAITVMGTDLGVTFSDLLPPSTIVLGGNTCTPRGSGYISGIQFSCRTTNLITPGDKNFFISINGRNGMTTAPAFVAVRPNVTGVDPSMGPVAGGTVITITGTDLDAGNVESTRVFLGFLPECFIEMISSTEIICRTEDFLTPTSLTVTVEIDNNPVSTPSVVFTYVENPNITSVMPESTIVDGGITLTFMGERLDIIQTPRIRVTLLNTTVIMESCVVLGSTISCVAPRTDPNSFQYDLILDGFTLPMLQQQLPISVLGNPTNFALSPDTERVTIGSTDIVQITGVGFSNVEDSEINITINGLVCVKRTISDTSIICDPPQGLSPPEAVIRVQIGSNIDVELVERLVIESPQDLAIIIGPAAAGVVLILFVVFMIIMCCIVGGYKNKHKKTEQRWTNLLNQMELLEMEMADECKRAFTELQTDLDDFMDIQDQNLPYRDFRTFAMRFLFPQDGDDHPILKDLCLPENADHGKVVAQLNSFRELVMDRKFLVIFVRSLEAQGPRFSLNDRCVVASLLMVCFQNDLDYSTEILQTLLAELMSKSMTKNSHPKLLLRRTESVAEKMLANWLAFLLFPYLLNHVGEKLFKLFRAIKSHLEKGPVDVITGEAKNSLSEEKLLRHYRSDIKVVDGLVVSDSGEEFPVRLLDCDSITQAKEKVLDVLFKNTPVSRRPQLTEIDLELVNTGAAGIPLRDQDATNVKEGDWVKVNTLGHYKLDEMSQAHADNPKNPTPKFRITVRPERPVSGTSFDFMGTIISNMAAGNRTSMLLTSEFGNYFHLVKPDPEDPADGQRGGKIVSEVFLTRLLSTKRILQPYVDDLFESIFAISQGRDVPKAIKSLFDFLDQQASDLGIQDPEILHTWKTNSVPLRFWVNVIKNPDFLFDINKSATVDACLTVIAQAYIDACSTTEFKYTKDTPAARLLYVNDVKKYKHDVQQYYSTVQSQPKVTQREMCDYLRETTQVCAQSIEQYSPEPINEKQPSAGPASTKGQLYFTTESSLYELFKFAARFSDEVTEGLNEEGLMLQSAKFDQIRRSMKSAT